MIFAGLELLGEIPFTDVIIHSTMLAPDGRRMSKSLGTGSDPMEPVERYGADATRYGVLKISSTQDVRFSYGAIEEGRKLANKLWNVSRLILERAQETEPEARPRYLEERWILARIDAARGVLEDDWRRFDFASSTDVLYHLTFDDFCDWYAEAIKPRLYDRDADAAATALAALERLLGLLAPGDAARHRGDLVAAAGSRGAADRLPLARADPRSPRMPAPRAGACGRADLSAERRPGRARLRASVGSSRRRSSRPREGGRQPGRRDRPPRQGDRARGGDARQRALRRERAAGGRRGRARKLVRYTAGSGPWAAGAR